MSCLQHMKLDLDLGGGEVIPLCARYSGVYCEIFRFCNWCNFSRDEILAEGTE